MVRSHRSPRPFHSAGAATGGLRVVSRGGRIPWWTALMLRFTTARLNDDLSIDRRIARRLHHLEGEGWLVRTAGPRNYTAWRNSDALGKPIPVIVLPNADFPFTQDERNVAVLRDLVVAELRMRQGSVIMSDERMKEMLIAIAGTLFPTHAIEIRYLEHLLSQINRKTGRALAGGSF